MGFKCPVCLKDFWHDEKADIEKIFVEQIKESRGVKSYGQMYEHGELSQLLDLYSEHRREKKSLTHNKRSK